MFSKAFKNRLRLAIIETDHEMVRDKQSFELLVSLGLLIEKILSELLVQESSSVLGHFFGRLHRTVCA